MADRTAATNADRAMDDTRRWLECAVIGLNLCPFAKAVHVKGQVHFTVSAARDEVALLGDLSEALQALHAADPQVRDTTLLIAPDCLHDFLAFNDFLDEADRLLDRLALQGELQIASFHPDYQFAGTTPDDVTNCTNRSPYPTLHLLRERSIDRAVVQFPDADEIVQANLDTMHRLGLQGWAAMNLGRSQ